MKKISTLGLIIVLVSILVVPTVYAAVVYDNGGPNQANGNEMTNWIQAEDFMLTSTQTINEVKFWAFTITDSPGYTGNLNYAIYDNNGGNPGAILASGLLPVTAAPTGVNTPFGPEYLLDFIIAGGFNASANTTYWLGLHNGDLTHFNRDEFYWETTNPPIGAAGDGQEMFLPGTSWNGNGQEHAFQLLAGVPEPTTMLLLGLGLVGLAGIRRKL